MTVAKLNLPSLTFAAALLPSFAFDLTAWNMNVFTDINCDLFPLTVDRLRLFTMRLTNTQVTCRVNTNINYIIIIIIINITEI